MSKREFINDRIAQLNDMSRPDSQHIQGESSQFFAFFVLCFSLFYSNIAILRLFLDKIKDLERKRLVIAAAEEQLNDLFREDPDKVSASSTGQKRMSKLSKTKKPAG